MILPNDKLALGHFLFENLYNIISTKKINLSLAVKGLTKI